MGRSKRQLQKQAKRAAVEAAAQGSFVNSGYGDFAASHDRQSFKKFTARSGSPSADIIRHSRTLRSRARALFMSAPIATSAIKALRTSVVGRGLHLHVMADHDELGISPEEAEKWGQSVEREFAIWAENPASSDILGLHDFYELQQLAFMSWKLSGDAFCLFRQGKDTPLAPYKLRLQLLEADRVSTPLDFYGNGIIPYGTTENGNKVYDGVEVDKNGAIVAYYIASAYAGDSMNIAWTRISKFGGKTGRPNILHLMDAERPEQLRGVPFIAPVLESIMQLSRYLQSEAVAALMETYLTGYITTETPDTPKVGNLTTSIVGGTEKEGEEEEDNDDRLAELEPEPGAIHQLLPGEKITFNDPKRPGSQFDPFVRSCATQIGAALEIPADVLLKSYNSSYSASRAALQDFWRMIIMNRDWFASDFCGEVYREWLTEAISTGRIKAPGFFTDPRKHQAWLGHEWNGSAMPHLDPVKEANAMQTMVANGWMTNKQATTHLNGGDWEKNIKELLPEAERLSKIQGLLLAAKSIKENSNDNAAPENE